MDDYQWAQDSLELVKKDLALDNDLDLTEADNPFEQLHRFLISQIQELMNRDFNRLLLAMYRIDVSEKKLKEVLELAEPGKIVDELADMIVERGK